MTTEAAPPPEPGMYRSVLAVGVGGAIGANVRHLVAREVANRWPTAFPWGTLLINLTGSLALGFIVGWLLAQGDRPVPRLFVATGFLGAYTTFSTFAYESVRLIEDGRLLTALAYVAASLIVCLWSAAIGIRAGERH